MGQEAWARPLEGVRCAALAPELKRAWLTWPDRLLRRVQCLLSLGGTLPARGLASWKVQQNQEKWREPGSPLDWSMIQRR